MAGPGEKASNLKALRWLEKAILILVPADAVNTSFDHTFFQLLYKHCVVFISSKVTWFKRCNDQIIPEFPQITKVGWMHYPRTPRLVTNA